MRFAILILAHTAPAQIKRLVNRLADGPFDCYIHVDKKVVVADYMALLSAVPNVYFVEPRIEVSWGGYSMVQASLNGIAQIAASGIAYASVTLLSGQDYPIKSAAYITEFLQNNIGKELILFRDIAEDWTEAQVRVDKYHFTDLHFRGRHRLQGLVNMLTPKRTLPVALKLYGQESYWTLSMACATYVADYLAANKKLARFLKYTWAADEFVFHSIIMASPFRDNVVNNNYRYMQWPEGGSHPDMLTLADRDKIMASGSLFARKFNMNVDAGILDLLDEAHAVA